MKAHAWQVTTKNGHLVTLFTEGEFDESSRLLKSGFRAAEEVRYRGEQDMPTFRGRPKSSENAVVTKGSNNSSKRPIAAKKREITGSARQRLLKQLAAARKVRMQNLKG